jgi:carboxymethylenebutenolidase
MSERIVSMHAAHRSGKEVVDGFLSRPIIGGERPAVVLVHRYRGLDDGQRAVTRRFAQEGFVCLSPDLFHGKTYHTLEDCALKKTSLDIPRAVANIVDSVPYLRKLPWVGKKKVAVLGFCMGGGLALYALAQSKAFDAGVIYYQSMFPDPEDLKSISAPMLCHYGTADAGTTQTEIDMFRESLDRYKRKYQIEMYAGAGHAFLNNPSSRNAANHAAAEKSVGSTTKWLKKTLA